jgi:hypothetical protein
MAWLRLTLQDGRACLVNTDQVSEAWQSAHSCANAGIRQHDGVTLVRETVEEIGEMIERGEARKQIERVFLAIVCNFPHGYDPEEIWEVASVLHHANKPHYRQAIIDG